MHHILNSLVGIMVVVDTPSDHLHNRGMATPKEDTEATHRKVATIPISNHRGDQGVWEPPVRQHSV